MPHVIASNADSLESNGCEKSESMLGRVIEAVLTLFTQPIPGSRCSDLKRASLLHPDAPVPR